MTYIYLNYENMKNVTASLTSYADKAEQAQSDVLSANNSSNNPSNLSNVSKLSEKVQELRDKAKEIDDRVELAKAQNENGTTVKDSNGSIAYYVPDNMEDNIDNAKSANQAIEDAKTLKEKKGLQGESEARDQIRQHCNSDAYAAAFVEHYGARETMKISQKGKDGGFDKNDPNVKLASTLLSRASRTWDKAKSQEMSNAIIDYLKSGEQVPPGVAFTSVLESADSDSPYGKDFLVGLANGVENIDNGYYLHPVVKAMRSTPDAALEYVVPDPSVDPNKAYETVISKLKLGQVGDGTFSKPWTDDWTFIMSACADKYGYEKVDDEHPVTDDAKRSALLAAAGVDWVGEAETKSISPEARHNLASVLKCYAWSVDEAPKRADQTGVVWPPASRIDVNPSDDGRDPTSNGLTVQPQFNTDNLARVLGFISRDQDDFSSVSRSVGELNANRMEYASAQMAKGDSGALQTAMNSSSVTRGFLIGAGHAVIEQDKADEDARNQAVIDTVMDATAFIPGLPESANFFAKAGYSFAENRGSAGIRDILENHFTNNFNKAVEDNSGIKADQGHRMRLELLSSLASGGAIQGPALDRFRNAVPKFFTGEQMDSKDLDALDDVIANPNGILNPEQQTAMTIAANKYQEGYNITHKQIKKK